MSEMPEIKSPQYLETSFVKPADALPPEYWTSLADAIRTISNTTGSHSNGCREQLDILTRCFEHPFNPIAVMPAMIAPEL